MPSTASTRGIAVITRFIRRRSAILLLAFCVVGLTATFLGQRGAGSPAVSENRVTRFVEDQYRLLAQGKYETLSANVAEGVWKGPPRGSVLSGLAPREDAVRQLEDDLGVGAWRLHFVTLEATRYVKVPRGEFTAMMRREGEILDLVDPSREVSFVSVVTMKGHNTGRCSNVEWERQVPVIERQGRYTILMRGAPAVYALVHNEQWFTPVAF